MACTTFSLENLHKSLMMSQQIIAHNLKGRSNIWYVETGMQNMWLGCDTASLPGGSACVSEQKELGVMVRIRICNVSWISLSSLKWSNIGPYSPCSQKILHSLTEVLEQLGSCLYPTPFEVSTEKSQKGTLHFQGISWKLTWVKCTIDELKALLLTKPEMLAYKWQ